MSDPHNNVRNDEQLMLDFVHGSAEAFDEIFRRYKQRVYGFFYRRCAHPATAEELTQETFLAIVRSRVRYEPRALFRTYLYAIALKVLRGHRRKAALRAMLFLPVNLAESAQPENPDAALWIQSAVAKLEPMDREIVMLREFEELSYAEIADVLRIAVNTVRSRLFRARMALRELLEPRESRVREVVVTAVSALPQVVTEKGDRA